MSASKEQTDEDRRCAECGMARHGDASRCWLCGHHFRVPAAAGRRARVSAWEMPFQFQLNSLFLTSGLICGCLGLARVAPRETIGVLVIVAIAYLRTALRVREWATFGLRVSPARKVAWFGTSTAIALAILAAGATVTVVVTAAGWGVGRLIEWWREEELAGIMWFVLGLAVGLFSGIGATVWAAVRLWAWPWPQAEVESLEFESMRERARSGSEISMRVDTLAPSEIRTSATVESVAHH